MIAAFALAAIPGVIVLEILEYGRPRTRERNGARAFAGYLIISLFAWIAAVLFLDGDSRLAAVIDSADESGRRQVDAYIALGWRLLAASVMTGCLLRGLAAGLLHLAFEVEQGKRFYVSERLSWPGAVARRFIAMPFAWDRLLERLRRSSKTQVVHVQFKDGEELYGVLAAEGHADYHADGRGLVLDLELAERDGELVVVPGSSGVFVAAEAVASIAFIESMMTIGSGRYPRVDE